VNRHRGGAVLLDEPELLYAIALAVKTAIQGRVPFTAKMRLGVRDPSRAIECAQALAAGGAESLVVHARTRDEAYRPPAHWPWVGRVAQAVDIPVAANGEIWTLDDYLRCRAESGRETVMLGRGALADPFLAARIRAHEAGDETGPVAQEWPRVWPLLEAYWAMVQEDVLPRHAPGRLKQWVNLLRRHYPQAEALFQRLKSLREVAQIDDLLRDFAVATQPSGFACRAA
jgi:tRNA-dihydrouridine synthase C